MGEHAQRYEHVAHALNDANRDEVIADLTGWLDRVVTTALTAG